MERITENKNGKLLNVNNTNEDIDVEYEIVVSQEYVNADTHDDLSEIPTIKKLNGKLINLNENVIIRLGNQTLEDSDGYTYKIVITRYDLQTRRAFFSKAG